MKRIEFKEIGIAGDNEIGFVVGSKFEDFVIAGIAQIIWTNSAMRPRRDRPAA